MRSTEHFEPASRSTNRVSMFNLIMFNLLIMFSGLFAQEIFAVIPSIVTLAVKRTVS